MLLLLSYLTWGRRLYRASQKCWATRPSARDSELTATSPKARRDLPRGSWKPVGGGALLRAGTSQTLTKPQEEGQGGGGGGDGARQHLESWEAAWG